MGGLDAHVGPSFHRRHRQVLVKLEVGAVSLVHQKDLSSRPAELGDLDQIGRDAVVRGAGHENGLGLGIFVQGVLDLVGA